MTGRAGAPWTKNAHPSACRDSDRGTADDSQTANGLPCLQRCLSCRRGNTPCPQSPCTTGHAGHRRERHSAMHARHVPAASNCQRHGRCSEERAHGRQAPTPTLSSVQQSSSILAAPPAGSRLPTDTLKSANVSLPSTAPSRASLSLQQASVQTLSGYSVRSYCTNLSKAALPSSPLGTSAGYKHRSYPCAPSGTSIA